MESWMRSVPGINRRRRQTMKMLYVILIAMIMLPFGVATSDEVEPATVELTLVRDVAQVNYASDSTYYQLDTLSSSNPVLYTGSDTNSPVQNLDGCSIEVVVGGTIGNVSTTLTAVGYVISTNAGTWGAEVTIPAISPCNIQVTVSNAASYTYQWQKVTTKAKLEDQ
jgi:hypothetical protein